MTKFLQNPDVQSILLLLITLALTSAILYTIPTDILLIAWQQATLLPALGYLVGTVSTIAIWGTSVYHLVTAVISGINEFVSEETVAEVEED